jgi:hypothetical protein
MFFAIVASRVYNQLAAIAQNEYVVCGYCDYDYFFGSPASLVTIGDAMPEAYASIGLTVTIRKNYLYPPLGVGDAFDNLPNGHTMRGVDVCTEGTKVLWGDWVHPTLLETCSKRPYVSMRTTANV